MALQKWNRIPETDFNDVMRTNGQPTIPRRGMFGTLMALLLGGAIACTDSSTQVGGGETDSGDETESDNIDHNEVGAEEGGGGNSSLGDKPGLKLDIAEEVLKELPRDEAQRAVLCKRGGRDKVRQVFCAANPPRITSLKELQAALGLTGNGNGGVLGAIAGSSGFTFTAHSSSLVARFVSAANPRLIMFNNQGGNVALGFVRGEQFAEVIAEEPGTRNLKFFLVKFTQACNESERGCTTGDLLGPAIEQNWKSVTVFEDVDIENTILDCKQCHQPGGEGTAKIFRMQELTNPWTHFMRNNTAGGRALLADFEAMHAGEEFAGIPANRVRQSDPARLERFVRGAGNGNQPNEFPSRAIEIESGIRGGGSGGGPNWQRLYSNFVKGAAIAPPYHSIKVADPQKFAQATQSYKQFRSGNLDGAELPDYRNIFPDSALRDLGFMVKANLSAEEILINACAQCHHSKLNQNISRAKFNVDLSKMSREEKNLAIERLKLPDNDKLKMPPVSRFRQLTADEIQKLEELLRR
jgi:hypothetical protein